MRGRSIVAVMAAACVLTACGGTSRADVVGAITVDAVPQRYVQVADDARAVTAQVAAWCTSGDPTAALAAIDATRRGWAELTAFDFGPANDRRSMFILDPRPRLVDIDALVESDQPVDAVSLRDLAGADQRGLGAIEHLLSSEPTDRGCAYATGASNLVSEEFDALAAEWQSYGDEIAVDDAAANIALRNIVSEALFALQMIADEPESPIAPALLEGARWALLGDDVRPGISPLLDAETRDRLVDEFDAGSAKELEITISTEVIGDLGTTVNFSDADGDG